MVEHLILINRLSLLPTRKHDLVSSSKAFNQNHEKYELQFSSTREPSDESDPNRAFSHFSLSLSLQTSSLCHKVSKHVSSVDKFAFQSPEQHVTIFLHLLAYFMFSIELMASSCSSCEGVHSKGGEEEGK